MVLFDEVDKATDVLTIMLQLFDEVSQLGLGLARGTPVGMRAMSSRTCGSRVSHSSSSCFLMCTFSQLADVFHPFSGPG